MGQLALAELLALSECPWIVLTNTSTFSIVAEGLGNGTAFVLGPDGICTRRPAGAPYPVRGDESNLGKVLDCISQSKRYPGIAQVMLANRNRRAALHVLQKSPLVSGRQVQVGLVQPETSVALKVLAGEQVLIAE